MRVDTLAALGPWILTGLLCAGLLTGCADDDPQAGQPPSPLAETQLNLPPGLPEAQQPRVLLLLDTSGSMQWRLGCTCTTPSCRECLPDCGAQQRSRWQVVLEALTGSFSSFGCQLEPRTAEAGASYDVGYAIPHVALAADVSQRDDGLLARLGSHVRFGLATFDSLPAYGPSELVPEPEFDWVRSRSEAGMSSYGGDDPKRPGRARVRPDGSVVGRVYFPASAGPFLIDTGIRSEQAGEGALLLPSAEQSSAERYARMQQQLLAVRPFGGSPVAAALDDIYFALAQNSETNLALAQNSETNLALAQNSETNLALAQNSETDARPVYTVLITDGLPDDDFRHFPSPGCACSTRRECGEDPSTMSCPYPLPSEAARHLRCGYDPERCRGRLRRLDVVGLLAPQPDVQQELDAIAASGGSERAHFVTDLTELNHTLDQLVASLLRDAQE